MSDRIRLRGLRVFGRHGVLAHERAEGQDFLIDLDLRVDLRAAAASDDVSDTVHYGELAEEVAAVVAGDPVDLIETLAARIADTVLRHERVREVRVTVHKPHAPITVAFEDVSVVIRRVRPEPVVIALGSNLGDRQALLASAVERLRALPGLTVTAESPALETVAVTLAGEDPGKPGYLNQVVVGLSDLGPRRLLRELLSIERAHGRERTERWGDRTLDLDLIAYGDRRTSSGELQLPHPRAAEREFVLRPWLLADPDAVLPGVGRVDALLAALTGADA
ncbi:dihydroneopterin aldolase [Naasia sp. SYSU D00948]|uniref:dihydroneopterin aldolase n=1 Tax=Naasia sp. SYSU D00948 TaxID=2817379 RepID=UPI001B313F10|nr:dihydroneopterin aldolase [Naasia sp. SYSU D00948]